MLHSPLPLGGAVARPALSPVLSGWFELARKWNTLVQGKNAAIGSTARVSMPGFCMVWKVKAFSDLYTSPYSKLKFLFDQ